MCLDYLTFQTDFHSIHLVGDHHLHSISGATSSPKQIFQHHQALHLDTNIPWIIRSEGICALSTGTRTLKVESDSMVLLSNWISPLFVLCHVLLSNHAPEISHKVN